MTVSLLEDTKQLPIIDLSLAESPETRGILLETLQDALINVGFFYVKNTFMNEDVVREVLRYGHTFFDLDDESKLAIEMKNSKHFFTLSKQRKLPLPFHALNCRPSF